MELELHTTTIIITVGDAAAVTDCASVSGLHALARESCAEVSRDLRCAELW